MKIYFDIKELWIGYQNGRTAHYFSIFPGMVVRFNRRNKLERKLYNYDRKNNKMVKAEATVQFPLIKD